MKKHLSWFSSIAGTNMGYGYASFCLITALQAKGVRVDFLNQDAGVNISFIQPEFYQNNPGQYSVGYTPWESSEIPLSWIDMMEQQDEIWTTSQFCADVYSKYGIESLVVPHGIDHEVFNIYERTLIDRFIFYHAGGPTERKGGQMVVDAFLDLFDGNNDVVLLMKSTGPSEARWSDKSGEYRGNVNNHPQIRVVEDQLDVEQMALLYHRSHCFVYPSKGEGFGLIPFQAMATGMPTIVTDATAMADYADLAIPLNSTEVDGDGIHLGKWAQPDFEHLKFLMKNVFDNWDKENKRSLQNARIIHTTQTWGHIAELVVERLGDRLVK